ncbi:MAG: pyridoxamine 5'-phosphate oxidase [Myxococcales bacterium]|nr:pyridoxamine 5'-phosphate oxidase [Myxococcales bacterium]
MTTAAGDTPYSDPIAWFRAAFAEAEKGEAFDPARAALATLGADSQPTVRFVLVKELDDRGFVFFTNYRSPKAEHVAAHPEAALAFHWASVGIQVRVEGTVERLDTSASDRYFASRPRGSQLGAWASEQSNPIADRAALDARFAETEARFEGQEVTRPAFWGGYRVIPRCIEYWQSRDSRLHDRWSFRRVADGWQVQRLQP